MSRTQLTFAALIATQAAHSLEEYAGRLWESFPPATFLTGLVSTNHEVGFVILNIVLVGFGVWCLLWPVRREWPSADAFIRFWIVISLINAVGHPAWTLLQGHYTPGVITAPVLGVLGVYLAAQLHRRTSPVQLPRAERS